MRSPSCVYVSHQHTSDLISCLCRILLQNSESCEGSVGDSVVSDPPHRLLGVQGVLLCLQLCYHISMDVCTCVQKRFYM